MVNDGLISALSRMENAASSLHGGPSNRRTLNVRQGSFADITAVMEFVCFVPLADTGA